MPSVYTVPVLDRFVTGLHRSALRAPFVSPLDITLIDAPQPRAPRRVLRLARAEVWFTVVPTPRYGRGRLVRVFGLWSLGWGRFTVEPPTYKPVLSDDDYETEAQTLPPRPLDTLIGIYRRAAFQVGYGLVPHDNGDGTVTLVDRRGYQPRPKRVEIRDGLRALCTEGSRDLAKRLRMWARV